MVQVYGDSIGYLLNPYTIAFANTESEPFYCFISSSTNRIYVFSLSAYNTQVSGYKNLNVYYTGLTQFLKPNANLTVSNLLTVYTTNGAYRSIYHQANPYVGVASCDNLVVSIQWQSSDRSSTYFAYYDIKQNQIIGDNQNALSFSTNYIIYPYISSNHLTMYYKTRASSGTTNFTSANVSGSSFSNIYIAGIFGDKFYYICPYYDLGSFSNTGYCFDLTNGTLQQTIGWTGVPDSDKVAFAPLYFDDRYIYMHSWKYGDNYGNKIFIYDTQTKTSNYSSITYSKGIGTLLSKSPMLYLGTLEKDGLSYFYCQWSEDSSVPLLVRINPTTGTYSYVILTGNANLYSRLNVMTDKRHKYIVKNSAIDEDGRFSCNGYVIDFLNGRIDIPVGYSKNNWLHVNVVNNNEQNQYSILKQYAGYTYVSPNVEYPGAIHMYGDTVASPLLSLCDAPFIGGYNTTKAYRLIENSIARIFSNFNKGG